MKIEICLDAQELRGTKMVRFELRDSSGANVGTFFVGKGGIRWRAAKSTRKYHSKSWNEVIDWLQSHGRIITR